MIKTVKDAARYLYNSFQEAGMSGDMDEEYLEYILNEDVLDALPAFLSPTEKEILNKIPAEEEINENFLLQNIKAYPKVVKFITNEFLTDYMLSPLQLQD